MFRATRILLVAVVAALALAGVGSTAGTAQTVRLDGLEGELLTALNDLREAEGLHPLRVSPGLTAAAVSHSEAMLAGGFFEHDSADGTAFHERIRRSYPSRGWSSWSVGENLLMNTVEIPVGEAMDAWLESPGHREIMLAPAWREVGIGALHAAVAGGEWSNGPAWVVTVDFGTRSGQLETRKPATAGTPKQRSAKPSKPKTKPAPKLAPIVPPPPVDVPLEPHPASLLDPHRLLLPDDGETAVLPDDGEPTGE